MLNSFSKFNYFYIIKFFSIEQNIIIYSIFVCCREYFRLFIFNFCQQILYFSIQLYLYFDNIISTIKYKKQNKFVIFRKNKNNIFVF